MDEYTRSTIDQILFDVQFHTGPYANVNGSAEIRQQALSDIQSALDTCEHAEEMIEAYKDHPSDLSVFCGNGAPHAPHAGCWGIFCDHGCNAEYF